MTTASVITVCCNACAMIVTALLILGVRMGGRPKEKLDRCFLAMLAGGVVGSATEFIFPLLSGLPGAAMEALRDGIVLVDYVVAVFVFVSFARYLYTFLSNRGFVSKKPFIIISCIYATQIPILISIGLYQIFGILGAGLNLLSQNQVQITAMIVVVSVILAGAVTLRHIKSHSLKKREWVSLLIYIAVSILGMLPEYFFEDVWVSWLGAAFAMLMIYLNIQVEQSRRLQEQELEMAESRTAIMLSQIQPHFMYNTLTAIEYLCNRDGAKQAGKVVRDFSKYLRGNMNSLSQKNPIPFASELAHTKLYLSIEQLQYEDRLRVEFDIHTDGFTLPALTLQPLVENAVKHGVSKREQGGTVTIRAEEEGNRFRVTVTDDGVGFDAARCAEDGRPHIGIENVRRRLEGMCGGSLAIESGIGEGTKAVLTIPK